MPKTIQIPHNYNPRDYQIDYLASEKRFSVLVWHRRSGKSLTVFNKQVIKALKTKGSYYYFLPTYKQAKSVVWESFVRDHLPVEIIKNKNNTELTIELVNGSILHYAGCEDIDRHRGINPIDVVFDEYSEMKPEIWTAIIQPILRQNKGDATFIFTPKGTNHAFNLLSYAKDAGTADWFSSVKSVFDTQAIEAEELAKARIEMPLALYEQEFECKFIDDATSVFRRIDASVQEFEMYPEEGHSYQLGVDLAKYNDYTVITVTDLNTFKCKVIDRFNQIDWGLQMTKIEAYARRYENGDVYVDCTGVGDPIFEDLQSRGLRVKEFSFTERSREQLLNNLAMLLEQGKIKICNNETLINELKSFRYELNGRKVRATAPDSQHDDCVMSLALSVWGLAEPLPINGHLAESIAIEYGTFN